jgi:hypothetical protein
MVGLNADRRLPHILRLIVDESEAPSLETEPEQQPPERRVRLAHARVDGCSRQRSRAGRFICVHPWHGLLSAFTSSGVASSPCTLCGCGPYAHLRWQWFPRSCVLVLKSSTAGPRWRNYDERVRWPDTLNIGVKFATGAQRRRLVPPRPIVMIACRIGMDPNSMSSRRKARGRS